MIVALALGRSLIGYHETDYVQFFVPDAQRLLDGEPLASPFHPPLYPVVIAAAGALLGDWLAAGLAVSLLSGLVVLLASHMLFLRLGGEAAAWGAILALLGSATFVGDSARAAADVFFLALFMGSCLVAVMALETGRRSLWTACGLIVGLALLTRTNAPPLLLLALMPLLSPASRRARVEAVGAVAGGLAGPVLAVLAFAAATGSQALPGNNHLSLATSFFASGDDRSSTDAALEVAGRFHSVTDVLLHDPVRVARIYLSELYDLAAGNLASLVEPPFYLMALPGCLLLLGSRWSPALGLVLAVFLAEILLTNLKQFHDRYYLFLVPLVGAGAGHMTWQILRTPWPPPWQTGFAALFLLMFLGAIGFAYAKVWRGTANGTAEVAQLVPAGMSALDAGSTVVARKPHLAFYTGAESVYFPDVPTLDELHAFLRAQADRGPLYLLYGEVERRLRPQHRMLGDEDRAPAWLEVALRSEPPGRWILYRYRPLPTAAAPKQGKAAP